MQRHQLTFNGLGFESTPIQISETALRTKRFRDKVRRARSDKASTYRVLVGALYYEGATNSDALACGDIETAYELRRRMADLAKFGIVYIAEKFAAVSLRDNPQHVFALTDSARTRLATVIEGTDAEFADVVAQVVHEFRRG